MEIIVIAIILITMAIILPSKPKKTTEELLINQFKGLDIKTLNMVKALINKEIDSRLKNLKL